MTQNRNLKQKVRSRAAKTGESYTSALRHLRPQRPEPDPTLPPATTPLRLAVAQTTPPADPSDAPALRAASQQIRRLMRQAREAEAHVAHFPEGATCAPHKRVMSASGPDEVGPAEWSKCRWDVLTEELMATSALARELELWVVLGAVHRLTPPNRPHNSLYVISDGGLVVGRYDERYLSNTKLSYMYTPGSEPITFSVKGIRFGCALGMESHYPEAFLHYERLDVHCVLFSTHGTGGDSDAGSFAREVPGHAAANSYWISYSTTTADAPRGPSGVVDPNGEWTTLCSPTGADQLAMADLELQEGLARPWRRSVRAGIYEPHVRDDDPRSVDRTSF